MPRTRRLEIHFHPTPLSSLLYPLIPPVRLEAKAKVGTLPDFLVLTAWILNKVSQRMHHHSTFDGESKDAVSKPRVLQMHLRQLFSMFG